jgi:hypothetical protein
VLALLPSSRWHFCLCHDAGLIALAVLAPLPFLPWHCTPPVNVLGLSIEEKDIIFCVHVG